MSLVFVSDAVMHAYNRDFRGVDRPTDVLSFPAGEGEDAGNRLTELGDILISSETAWRQAEEYGHSFEQEIERLMIHGVLHLLGHDHQEPEETRRMKAAERRLLKLIESAPIR